MTADPVVLETDRARLRAWRPDEADRFLDTYTRWEVARWLGATPSLLRDHDEAIARIERWTMRNAEHPGRGLWAIERTSDGVVVGTVLLVPLPDGEGEVEVGWHLHPDSWGHGYATEAARGVLSRAFDDGLDEVLAVVRPGNDASIAVCARLGMERRGLTNRYYGADLELFRLAPSVTGTRASTH